MRVQQNPKVEWGFYAVTPRIVRTQYKQLSHAEKWLYTCLKDLCGDKGTCFRTLRALKEETDISIASLSTMIPRLHEAGLIHAEKKRRSSSGKEVWHISIVDIWQTNKDYCSENEQRKNEIVQNLNTIVQIPNNGVQILNKNTPDCSENERDCSNFRTRRITQKNNPIEERTDEEQEGTYSGANRNAASGSAHATLAHAQVPSQEYLSAQDASPESNQSIRIATEQGGTYDNNQSADRHHLRTIHPASNHSIANAPAQESQKQRQQNDRKCMGDAEDSAKPESRDNQASAEPAQRSTSQVGRTGKGPEVSRAGYKQETLVEPEKPCKARTKKASDEPELTEGGQIILDAWNSLFKVAINATPAIITSANSLYSKIPPWAKDLKETHAQVLDRIQKHLYTTDKNGYYKRGVKLWDVDREFEGWQSAMMQDQAKQKPATHAQTVQANPYSLAALLKERHLVV